MRAFLNSPEEQEEQAESSLGFTDYLLSLSCTLPPPPIPKSWIHPCYGLVVCMVYDLPDLIHTWLSIRDSSHIVANYSGFALPEIPDFPVHPGSLTALGTCLDTLFPIVCTEYSLVCSARSTSPHSLADSGAKSSL